MGLGVWGLEGVAANSPPACKSLWLLREADMLHAATSACHKHAGNGDSHAVGSQSQIAADPSKTPSVCIPPRPLPCTPGIRGCANPAPTPPHRRGPQARHPGVVGAVPRNVLQAGQGQGLAAMRHVISTPQGQAPLVSQHRAHRAWHAMQLTPSALPSQAPAHTQPCLPTTLSSRQAPPTHATQPPRAATAAPLHARPKDRPPQI